MAEITQKYPSLSDVYRDLTLFFKKDSGIPYSLADFTSIAQGRWQYFLNNWDFIKLKYFNKINAMPDGVDKVNAKAQYKDFSNLVRDSRASSQNPLLNRNNLRKYKDLLDAILINDLDISQAENAIINNDLSRISNLKKDDFLQMRERVRITHDKSSDSMGLGDPTYNSLYERTGGSQIITFTLNDYDVLSSLISLMNTITLLIPMKLVQDEHPDPFSVVRTALNNSAIAVASSTSGFLVPFPAGSTLERLSQKYLGTPDRWIEIATANNLRFPYVDEMGQKVPLLINGINNIVIVSLTEYPNFFIGQSVSVGSNGKPLTVRNIVSIEEDKNNSQLLITVDGDANLSMYTTVQQAFIFYFMPYTINSSKFIMIPAAGSLGFPINAEEPWFIKSLPSDVKNMGVDLALGSDGDLVFDSTGDLSYVYGLANAAQALNLKVQTKANDLIRDPTFGIIEIVGKYKNSEISGALISTMIGKAISGDDRFDGVSGLGFTVSGNAVYINASIRLKGSTKSLPLTFQLPKG